MPLEKPIRRLPLRDLLTDAEKRTRDLFTHLHTTWLARAADLRELSRPVRRRSHFPTVLALQNAIAKMNQTCQETDDMVETLFRELEEIRQHAHKELARRR